MKNPTTDELTAFIRSIPSWHNLGAAPLGKLIHDWLNEPSACRHTDVARLTSTNRIVCLDCGEAL